MFADDVIARTDPKHFRPDQELRFKFDSTAGQIWNLQSNLHWVFQLEHTTS